MRTIFGGRKTGKTSRVIEWLKESPSNLMIVADRARKNRLLEYYREDVLLDQVLTITEVVTGSLMGRKPCGVFVDDADDCFNALLARYHCRLVGLTLTDSSSEDK